MYESEYVCEHCPEPLWKCSEEPSWSWRTAPSVNKSKLCPSIGKELSWPRPIHAGLPCLCSAHRVSILQRLWSWLGAEAQSFLSHYCKREKWNNPLNLHLPTTKLSWRDWWDQKKRGKFLREKGPIWCVTAAEERAGVSGAHYSSTNCPEERMLLDSLTPVRFKVLSAKVNTIISPSWEISQDLWEERGNCNRRNHASPLLQHPPSK